MKRYFTKIMGVALLCIATFMTIGCSKDDNTDLSTMLADHLITTFTDAGILVDGALADGAEYLYLTAESEDEAIEWLESVVLNSVDTSGEMVILADASSYVNIVKSSIEGVYYNVIFSLGELDLFEAIIAQEAYFNSANSDLADTKLTVPVKTCPVVVPTATER